MAAFSRGKIFSTLWCHVRHKSKPNIQRPKPGPWERRVLVEVTKPVLPTINKPPAETCTRRNAIMEAQREEFPYEKFLKHEARKMFTEHQMVVICQNQSVTMNEFKTIRNKMFKQDIFMRLHSNEIVRQVIADSRWSNLAPVIVSHNLYIYSVEPKVSELMKIVKQTPAIHVMCGIVENQLMNKADLERYSATSLDLQRAQLSATLNSCSAHTYSLLNRHQQSLSSNLTQYVKQNEKS